MKHFSAAPLKIIWSMNINNILEQGSQSLTSFKRALIHLFSSFYFYLFLFYFIILLFFLT